MSQKGFKTAGDNARGRSVREGLEGGGRRFNMTLTATQVAEILTKLCDAGSHCFDSVHDQVAIATRFAEELPLDSLGELEFIERVTGLDFDSIAEVQSEE